MTIFDDMRQQLDLLNDEELLSILREHDEEQWRPEAFDIVASILRERGVALDTGAAQKEEIPEDLAGLHLVTVASYFDHVDAEADLDVLEAKNIRGWILKENVAEMEEPSADVRLKVLPEDLNAAIKILDAGQPLSPDLPDEIAGPSCPRCGSREIAEEEETVESYSGSTRNRRSSPQQIWLYRCRACGYKWSESKN